MEGGQAGRESLGESEGEKESKKSFFSLRCLKFLFLIHQPANNIFPPALASLRVVLSSPFSISVPLLIYRAD